MKTEPGVKIHNSRVQESGGFYCRTGETGSRGATPATGPHARNAGVRAHGEERTEGGGRRRKEGRMAGKRRGGRTEGRKEGGEDGRSPPNAPEARGPARAEAGAGSGVESCGFMRVRDHPTIACTVAQGACLGVSGTMACLDNCNWPGAWSGHAQARPPPSSSSSSSSPRRCPPPPPPVVALGPLLDPRPI